MPALHSQANPSVLPFRPSPRASALALLPDFLLGPSPAITRVWSQIRRVAPYFRTALLTGEPGSGHAAAARALHQLSPFANRSFTVLTAAEAGVRLSTSGAPRFASEMLFFPDLELLSPAAQQGLLRLARLRRQYGVALVAAASRDLRPLVAAGVFSAELAALLSALHIALPALRQRREDIPALTTRVLDHEARAAGLEPPPASAAFLDAVAREAWPGNLDQLHQTIRELVRQFPDNPADASHLQEVLASPKAAPIPAAEPFPMLKLEDIVQRHIRGVLLQCNGNKLRAAEVLGISRSTLYRMLESAQVSNRLPLAS